MSTSFTDREAGPPERSLTGHLKEARAFLSSIDGWVLQRQTELTSIPAPPFQEGPRGARMAELMEEVGLEGVRTDRVGNVLGALPSGRLLSHRGSGAEGVEACDLPSDEGPLILSAATGCQRQ